MNNIVIKHFNRLHTVKKIVNIGIVTLFCLFLAFVISLFFYDITSNILQYLTIGFLLSILFLSLINSYTSIKYSYIEQCGLTKEHIDNIDNIIAKYELTDGKIKEVVEYIVTNRNSSELNELLLKNVFDLDTILELVEEYQERNIIELLKED